MLAMNTFNKPQVSPRPSFNPSAHSPRRVFPIRLMRASERALSVTGTWVAAVDALHHPPPSGERVATVCWWSLLSPQVT
ncbi:unnamed protein product [Boreogadus saida]